MFQAAYFVFSNVEVNSDHFHWSMDVRYIGSANENTRKLPIERRENYIRKSAFDIIATPCFSRRTKSGVLPQFCAAVTSPMQRRAESDVSGSEFTAESPVVSLRFRTTARGRIAIAGMCRNCIMRNSHDRVSFLKWDMGVIWAICMHGQSE